MQPAKNSGEQLASFGALLYLVHLLALPGIALGVLVWLNCRSTQSNSLLARYHLRLALNGSLIATCIIAGGSGLLWLGFSDSPTGISMVLLYAITSHTFCVLWGIFCLAKAMSGKMLNKQ